MNDATVKLVDALAAKLDTTAEHLWRVLTAQAPIDGACWVLVFAASIAGLVWAAKIIRVRTQEREVVVVDPCGFKTKERVADWSDDLGTVAWVVWIGAAVLILVGCSLRAPYIIAAFFNPEYWALKQLLP